MEKKIIYSNQADGFHKAKWILIDPWTIIENGCLEVENSMVKTIHPTPPAQKIIDHGPGVIMPSLVNAHLHLELSALKQSVPFDQGFKLWVQELLKKRATLTDHDLGQAALNAAKELVQNGTLWVADIASMDVIGPLADKFGLKGMGLQGIFFQEFLGTHLPANVPEIYEKKDSGSIDLSYAAHAPHTTSPELIKSLKKQTLGCKQLFSIHVAESMDETQFIADQKGEWADFLTSRGIDWNAWDIKGKTPVQHLYNLGILDSTTLAVHLLNVTKTDIQLLADTQTKVCCCPRSNQNLHSKLPDIVNLIDSGLKPALGTDSLASCDSLDIFDEMSFVSLNYSSLDPATILAMGTVNGAYALGVERLTGSLENGRQADLLYCDIHADNTNQLLEHLVSNEN